MIYKPYGATGKSVSAIGFGGMRFDMTRSEEENAELLLYALSKGINYFDTAPYYCNDRSEIIFGKAIKQMKGEFFVTSKANPEDESTAQAGYDAVRRSLDRLCVDKINFFHVWCLRRNEHFELAMKPGGLYEGLVRAKEDGLIEHITFSSHQPGHEIRKELETGFFDGVLLGMNILNFPYRWDGAKAAKELNYGVVTMNPLSGGMIPKNEDRLRFLERDGMTPTESALAFLVGCKEVSVALVGITTKAHIDTACAIADKATPVDETELERLKAYLGENINTACTGCGYCDDCPQQISIPNYMQFYNNKQIFGESEQTLRDSTFSEMKFGTLSNTVGRASDCIACGQCEKICTQHIPIIDRLTEMAQWEQYAIEMHHKRKKSKA